MKSSDNCVRILYTHSSSLVGGGNKVLLSLLEGLDRSRFEPFSLIPVPGPIEDYLSRLDVPYATIDIRPRPGRRIASLLAVGRLIQEWRRRRIDLLHANDPMTYRLSSVAADLCGGQKMCHVHHPDVTSQTISWSFRRPPQLVVTPSLFMKRTLEGCLDGRQHIPIESVWNPIDTEWFIPSNDLDEVRNRLGLSTAQRHVSIVGALAPHKGHECFLRMAQAVIEHLPETMFHIVGSAQSGDRRHAERLRTLAAEWGIAGNVRFWGFVPDETTRDLLASSDLFVLPTREEGFGLSIAEAQSCEVPVLTSEIAPLDEVVDAGRTGYLLPPDDVQGFASRAIELLRSPETRASMGKAARNWVVSRFSKKRFIQSIESLYDRLPIDTRSI